MTDKQFYQQFANGAQLVCTCVGIGHRECESLMQGARRCDRKQAIKAAVAAGVITEDEGRKELTRPYYNPYTHLRTDKHIIYVHSSVEHFISPI